MQIRPEEGYIKCPEFREEQYSKKYARLWKTMSLQTDEERCILDNRIGMYAICADNENTFQYWIVGVYRDGIVPEGFELIDADEGEWAVFSAKGPLPDSFNP